MKNRLLFVIALLLASFGLSAENVSSDAARQKAMDFFKSNSKSLSVSRLDMVYDGSGNMARSSSQAPALYVFDNPDGKGFVIVSGDDIAYPILGYSFEFDFPEENIPEHVKWWLQGMEDRINYGRENGWKPAAEPQRASDNIGYVVKKLNTALWDQGYPYNMYIPQYNGQDCYTGCTATSTAIIMYYHKHPEKGTGTLPAFVTSTHSISVPETPLGHTYQWNNMLDKYSGSYQPVNGEAVALLMRDVACGLQSDFTPSGTGAYPSDIPALLQDHFGYDKGAIYQDRWYYTNDAWTTMLKDELDKNRPVLYRGRNDDSGHAFVLDGYTTEDYFSVNWGWSGHYNGYFLLDALVPSGSGSGGNNDHYNFSQGCVIGLIPDAGGDYVLKLSFGQLGLSIDDGTDIITGSPFVVYTNGIRNIGTLPFVGDIICALVDEDGDFKETLYTFTITDAAPLDPHYWIFPELQFNVTITGEIKTGDRIRVYYKAKGAAEWIMMDGGEECVNELVLTAPKTISESTSITFNKIEEQVVVNTRSDVTVELFASNSSDYSSYCETNGKVTTIDAKALPADTYTIKLTDAKESVSLKIKVN